MSKPLSPVLFIPHGGGPLPLLGHEAHQKMVAFLQEVPSKFSRPDAILVISAHWEEEIASVTSSAKPALLYDYYGFPEETYQIQYPVTGNTALAQRVVDLLRSKNIKSTLDEQRGLDHGVFVPLKIMYPNAEIPCIELSLLTGLDPQQHIDIGKALAELRHENILILGSGFSFHNLPAMLSPDNKGSDEQNAEFESWLIETCTGERFTTAEREQRLVHWSDAPGAKYCHPREEHLMPLHVCYGCCESRAKLVFNDLIMNKSASAYLW